MNQKNLEIAKNLVNDSYLTQGFQAGHIKRQNMFKSLLSSRRLPNDGWDDATIELVLNDCALLDSNNFEDNVGVGEREARVYSSLVAKRHYRMGHGIGRSGDIAEIQPKAAGSSLLHNITRHLIKDALRLAGLELPTVPLLLPLATGMSMTLALLSLKNKYPNRSYIIWPRIDQKSCLKAIFAAGCIPVIIENKIEGDALVTDMEAIEAELARLGEEVLCVMTTTSCFAPRQPDSVTEVARACQNSSVAHVINNAYGVQCSQIMKEIARACRVGRVDMIIQSTDKNFMVPVGGAIVASPNQQVLQEISKTYPGRANSSPLQDMFITLLSMGAKGYQELLQNRESLISYFRTNLTRIAEKYGERVLHTPKNSISFGVTLKNVVEDANQASYLGSMLFKRCISGTRVVTGASSKEVGNIVFPQYGAHINDYPEAPYFTAACAIGITHSEIDMFCLRLDKTIQQYLGRKMKDLQKRQAVDQNNNTETG